MAPDFGLGNSSGLKFRGNCVWTRIGDNGQPADGARDRREVDRRFGFIIWQYCVDLFRDQESDSEFRTLRGTDLNGENVTAVFHIEVITEEVFTEEWEPFSDKTRAQSVFESVLDERVECENEICMKNYRTKDMRIIYGLLSRVGMHPRDLRGDDKSLEKLRRSTGRVVARLPSTTRTSFLVLIIAVNVIFLAQSLSTNEEEVEHIALLRAIGELKNVSGASQFTAIALPRMDMTRRWASSYVECFVVGSDSCSADELLEKVMGAKGVPDENGDLVGHTRDGLRFVRAMVPCDALQYADGAPDRDVLP
eukprot:TRINITY_DN69_c0_g5_i1.p1 TRINITY_DN69_c0_g5~~TRINITY_DN69_c0_g5_i1.p1  ORF type:complete len:308 (+),score=35.64 TRINITY_DN69_c0_g5_i1:945-1868(+)